jgi:hypothetical protein
MMHLGDRHESKPPYQTVLLKSLFFGLLVLAFHFLEEFIKRLIHHEPFGTVWHNINMGELTARSIIVFCAFVPLFAFLELRHLVGGKEFYALFLKPADTYPVRKSPA